MAQSITDKILAEYNYSRTNAELARNKRVSEIHGQVPELAEIHAAFAGAGHRAAMKIASNPDCEDEIRVQLNNELAELQSKREKLLAENNLPLDYDKIHYKCPLCHDTGYIENEKCSCYRAKITKYTYEQSNMSQHMKETKFDKFDFRYFSDEPDKSGISSLQRIKKAYNEAKTMTEKFPDYQKSFLFFGEPGTGKTFLSGCVATALIDRGYSVLYITASRLFEIMENKKYSRPRNESDDELIDTAYSCDLLILDDLGAEPPSKLAPSFIYDILNERMMANKKMIINSNLDPDKLSALYSQRLVSRFFEHFYAIKFTTKDIRKQKMYE